MKPRSRRTREYLILGLVLHLMMRNTCADTDTHGDNGKAHSRQKRLIWITSDGRLALPPGTSMIITPTIALPFVRYPLDGYLSNITVSLPFTIDFDKLGLTDNENPYGVVPPLLARSMGRAAGTFLADYISQFMGHRRRKRGSEPLQDPSDPVRKSRGSRDNREPPRLAKEQRDAFHGGERALLYAAVEDMLTNFGLDGKACLLRTICEVHAHRLESFGLLGEMLRLFFTASKSPYAVHLDEYVMAERAGTGLDGAAECWPYHRDCPRSLFRAANKYTEDAESEADSDLNDVDENISSLSHAKFKSINQETNQNELDAKMM